MAEHTQGGSSGPRAADMKGHVATYSSVIAMLKWGAVACFLLAFLIIWLIYK